MSPQKWPPETRWICLRTSTLPRHHDGPRGRTEVGPRHAMENGRLKGVLGTRTVWQGGMSRGDEREAELSPVGIVFPPGRCRGNTGPLPGCARCHNNNANDRLTSGVGSLTWRSVRGLWRRSNHIKREVQRPKGEVNFWDVWAGVWRYSRTIVGFRLSGCATVISAIEWRYSGQKECEFWKASGDQAAPSLSEGS